MRDSGIRLYTRISLDDVEEDRPDDKGVSRQQREGLAFAKRHGWGRPVVVVDNDLGASRQSRNRARPGYDRLVSEVRSGVVSRVLVRDLDRLSRMPAQYEDWIGLVEETGVELWSYKFGRMDLTSATGRMFIRFQAAQAAGESDRISERVSAQRADAARRGRPVVAVDGFGWRDGDPVPDEAAAIRSGAAAVVAGATLASIARDWNSRGVRRRRTARPWRGPEVAVVLRNPRHAGWATYRGEIVAERDGPTILDRATWESVVAVLGEPERRRGPRAAARTLSGVMRCGLCGARLRRGGYGPRRGGGARRSGWMCNPDSGCGRLGIIAEPVEANVEEALMRRFDGGLPEVPRDSAAAVELRVLDEEARQLGDAYAAGRVPMVAFLAASEALESRRRSAADRAAPELAAAALQRYRRPGALRAAWPDLTEVDRNALVRRVIDAVVVAPSRQGARRPLERITVRWLV